MSDNPLERLFGSANFQKQVEEHTEMVKAATRHYNRRVLERVQKWRAVNPEKVKAQSAVGYAIRTGELTPGQCIINDQYCHGQIEAHHWHGYDEAHWLDVVWMCKFHHEQADTK